MDNKNTKWSKKIEIVYICKLNIRKYTIFHSLSLKIRAPGVEGIYLVVKYYLAYCEYLSNCADFFCLLCKLSFFLLFKRKVILALLPYFLQLDCLYNKSTLCFWILILLAVMLIFFTWYAFFLVYPNKLSFYIIDYPKTAFV